MPRPLRVFSHLGLLGLSLMLLACAGGSSRSAPSSSLTVAETHAVTPPMPTIAPSSSATSSRPASLDLSVREFDVVAGSHPHDVAPAPDGGVWFTDGGLDAIVRVDAQTSEVTAFPLPADRRGANLNTAVFDGDGILWFTGQTGIYGRLDPATREIRVFDDPEGRGPYGITVTPSGDIWYASLAGNHIANVDRSSGMSTIVEPPTPNQGARRVWSDSRGRIWVSEWNAGQIGVYDPSTSQWNEWRLPGRGPQTYAVYVDDRDIVWLTDFTANAIVRFDPSTARFEPAELPSSGAAVRQLLGRTGEIWGAESARDKLVLVTAD